MIAVCGIGKPSGRRNSAVTANQSAKPPTIAASAAARTKLTHIGAPVASARFAIKYVTAEITNNPVATDFILLSCWRLIRSLALVAMRSAWLMP